MLEKVSIILRIVLAGVLLTLLLVGVSVGRKKLSSTPYEQVVITIVDSTERQYVTTQEIRRILSKHQFLPQQQSLQVLPLQAIEDLVQAHPMVRHAQCYYSPHHTLHIRITQRIPLLRVLTADNAYLVDTDRQIMPIHDNLSSDILTARGKVGKQMATHDLADFAQWLQEHPYWQQRIQSIEVHNSHLIYLQQYNNQEDIVLGDIQGFTTKLQKLQTYYQHRQDIDSTTTYQQIDIRYKGQVIGRK